MKSQIKLLKLHIHSFRRYRTEKLNVQKLYIKKVVDFFRQILFPINYFLLSTRNDETAYYLFDREPFNIFVSASVTLYKTHLHVPKTLLNKLFFLPFIK